MKIFTLIFCGLGVLAAGCTTASIELARATQPVPVLFETAADCLSAASQILPAKEAGEFCLEARRLEAHRAEAAAKEAAKAQAARATVAVVPTTGSGHYAPAVVAGPNAYVVVPPARRPN